MTPVRLDVQPKTARRSEISSGPTAFLNHLRFVAMRCRTKPRTDLFKACALLHANNDSSRMAHAEALMRCLNEALGKPARLHAPGVDEISFDEAWLVQLDAAHRRQDDASLTFLLTSRVAQEHRRLVGFLIHQISEFFTPV